MNEANTKKYACPCCGYKTYSEYPNGTYLICPVCFWEDDPVQLDNPDFAGGANPLSLRESQKNFVSFGACDEGMKPFVRKHSLNEERDNDWKPLQDKEKN